MPIRFCFILLLLNCKSFGQSSAAANDSLIARMCQTLVQNKEVPDTQKIKILLEQHINPYMEGFDEEHAKEVFDNIFIRAQRQCQDFGELIGRLSPNKGDWAAADSKPVSKMDKRFCGDFLKAKQYYYLEANGDTVNLTLKDNLWIDHFRDNSFSKLKFRWIGDCEFEIEFIESNNKLRKDFSKPGDKYRYQVLQKEAGYYLMSVEIVGKNQFMTFRIYYS